MNRYFIKYDKGRINKQKYIIEKLFSITWEQLYYLVIPSHVTKMEIINQFQVFIREKY